MHRDLHGHVRAWRQRSRGVGPRLDCWGDVHGALEVAHGESVGSGGSLQREAGRDRAIILDIRIKRAAVAVDDADALGLADSRGAVHIVAREWSGADRP